MIGNPYPQFQNVQEWNDFVNEVRHVLARTERTLEDIKARVLAGEGEYDFPEATDEEAGVLKLYGTTGTSEDGTITQKGITQAINDARYTLPSATETRLGGVKVGDRLSVDEKGQLSADDQSYTLPVATDSVLGGVKTGQGLEIEEDGTLNAAGEYSLPIASDSILGGVKIGEGLNIDENGVVSADSGSGGSGGFYGVCSTAAATAAKTVACQGFKLETGVSIIAKFTVTNTASSPTINVNSTGAKSIYYRGAAIDPDWLVAGQMYELAYDGTNYNIVGDVYTGVAYNIPTRSGLGNIWIE